MGECLQMGDSPAYQQLKGLQDIRSLRDLTPDSVRDILRGSLRDPTLTLTTMGQLQDMSGTNDAFNSSICSLEVTVSIAKKSGAKNTTSSSEDNNHTVSGGANGSTEPPPTNSSPAKESTQLLLPSQEDPPAAPEEDRQSRTIHFVIKAPPKASFIKMIHKMSKPFLNEVTWYLELLKQIELLEKELPDNGFRMSSLVPTCYHAYSNYYWGEVSMSCASCPWFCWLPFRSAEEGILLMQNVKFLGYQMVNKMQILPLENFLLVMQKLAHFHGRWLTYRWMAEAGSLPQGSWTPDHFKSALDTQKRVPKFIYKELLKGTHKTVARILELEGQSEHIERVRKFFHTTAPNQLTTFMGEIATPIDTCCHGDFWSNNIMFKYDEDGKATDVVLVDFQLINYGHPAYDILYLLYLSADTAFRDAHMQACLQTYWDIFKVYIDQFAPKGFKYEWTDFLKDVNTYKTVGFVLATTLLPNVLSDIQLEAGGLMALRNMQRKQAEELEDSSKPTSREIKRRIAGLVSELIRDNVI